MVNTQFDYRSAYFTAVATDHMDGLKEYSRCLRCQTNYSIGGHFVRVVLPKSKSCSKFQLMMKLLVKLFLAIFLVGFAPDDTEEKLDYLVHKITNLRVFEDENGKMNKGLRDVNGAILSVSPIYPLC